VCKDFLRFISVIISVGHWEGGDLLGAFYLAMLLRFIAYCT
jgi:hypothetical protein